MRRERAGRELNQAALIRFILSAAVRCSFPRSPLFRSDIRGNASREWLLVKRKHTESNRRSRNSSLLSSSPENEAVLQFAARYSCYASVKVPNEATLKSSRDRCPRKLLSTALNSSAAILARFLPLFRVLPLDDQPRDQWQQVNFHPCIRRGERRGISGDRLRHGDTRARPDTGICRGQTYV